MGLMNNCTQIWWIVNSLLKYGKYWIIKFDENFHATDYKGLILHIYFFKTDTAFSFEKKLLIEMLFLKQSIVKADGKL